MIEAGILSGDYIFVRKKLTAAAMATSSSRSSATRPR